MNATCKWLNDKMYQKEVSMIQHYQIRTCRIDNLSLGEPKNNFIYKGYFEIDLDASFRDFL